MQRITPMLSVGALALSTVTFVSPATVGAAEIEATFSFTGSTVEWIVPDDISQITVEAFGAEGGASAAAGFSDVAGIETSDAGAGGLGGTTTATIAVSPGETLILAVGGAGGSGTAIVVDGDLAAPDEVAATATGGAPGFNGGGCGVAGAAATSTQAEPGETDFDNANCGGTVSATDDHGEVAEIAAVAVASGGGGGATTVRRGAEVLVAAGGGGGGGAAATRNTPDGDLIEVLASTGGGDGGGEVGGAGVAYSEFASAAGGGTQSAAGASGPVDPSDDPSVEQQGALAMNGGTRHVLANAGGGAGGGWHPGGASSTGSSGGGGSSHPVTDTASGVHEGDGLLRISGEAASPTTPDTGDGAVAPDAVEAPRPSAPAATATVDQPRFTG